MIGVDAIRELFAEFFELPESMNYLMAWEQRDGMWKASANMFGSNA